MYVASDEIKYYVELSVEEASEGEFIDILMLMGSLNGLLDEMAEQSLDQEISFDEKFQIIADMQYVASALEDAMAELTKDDLLKLMSDDPYDRIMFIVEEL